MRIFEEDEQANQIDVHKYTVDEITKVVDFSQKKIEMCMGKFIHSGFNIWTQQQVVSDGDEFKIESKLNGRKINLVIDINGEYVVDPSQINVTDR